MNPVVVLIGAGAAGGAEIAAQLQQDGHTLCCVDAPDLNAWLASTDADVPVEALVVHGPVQRSGLRFDQIDDAAFEQALQTQLLDVVLATQSVLPRMHAGARIVFTGARGHLGAWGGVHQMAASAALAAMARSMALELAPEGIRVNLVAAAFTGDRVDTADLRASVARTVSFLCAAGPGLSGETLLVDGLAALRMTEARAPGPDKTPPPSTP